MKYIKKVKQLPLNDKYFLISDIHLGIGDGADNSAHNQHIIFHLLSECLNKKIHVIALGDLFEMALNKDIEQIKNHHDDIMWILGELDRQDLFTYVRGNHDAYVKEKDIETRTHQYDGSIVPFIESEIYDAVEIGNFLLVHGHQVIWRYASWFNRVVIWLGRHAWHGLQNLMCKDPSTDQQGWQDASDTDLALQKVGEEQKKIIIAGHTHKCKALPGYFNIGSFGVLPRTVTYGILDYGTISIRKCRMTVGKDNYLKISDEKIRFGEKDFE